MRYAIPLVLALSLGACSKSSSPTEPARTASLNGYVHLCGYNGGTVTVVDVNGHKATTSIDAQSNYAFGTVFDPGPYDFFASKPVVKTNLDTTHTNDSTTVMKVGENHHYEVDLYPPWMPGC
jgi:hypothetical protein